MSRNSLQRPRQRLWQCFNTHFFQRSIVLESAVYFLPYPTYHKFGCCTERAERSRCGGAAARVIPLRTSIVLARRVFCLSNGDLDPSYRLHVAMSSGRPVSAQG